MVPADWKSDEAWDARVARDRERAWQHQTQAQRRITDVLLSRALELGAEGFALTGSTARGRRTAVSDLDYHVVGARPDYADLHDEIDIVSSDAATFRAKLVAGDDYVQWTLRHGCILLDRTGVFREGLRLVATERLWPEPARKRERLPVHRSHAERLIAMGDRDAAQEQMRAALTSAARVVLLDAGVFPLSRRELPAQLRATGWDVLAAALEDAIHSAPPLNALTRSLHVLDEVIEGIVVSRHAQASSVDGGFAADRAAVPARSHGR